MTAYVPSLEETDLKKINLSIQQLASGRSNAVGTVTCSTDTSTTVTNSNCSSSSVILLTAQTANAAGFVSVLRYSASNGSFSLIHPSTSSNDRTFGYAIVG